MTNEIKVDELNRLIHVNKDAEAGLLTAADRVKNSELESLFLDYAKQHATFATQLQAEIERVGGKPSEAGGMGEALHRGWMELKSAVTGHSAASLLAFCESGEESAEVAYHDASDNIPTGQAHALIAKHHEQIKGFRTRLCRLVEQSKSGIEYPKNE